MSSSVLVVDDDLVIRDVLARLLQDAGLPVVLVDSGEAAIHLYRQEGASIGLVLLDINMPGLDGVETFKVLRDVNPTVRCLFMTGWATKYSEPELREVGGLGLLNKPFPSLEATVGIVQNLLSDQAQVQANRQAGSPH